MNIRLLLVALLSSVLSFAQFEYSDFNSYGGLTDIFQYDGKIYGIPIGSSTILEIDRESEEINEYNIYNDFPMRWKRAVFQVDNYVVVLNHDDNVTDFRGFLSLNLDSKEHTFLDIEDEIGHYKNDPVGQISYVDYADDGHTIYVVLNTSILDKYAVITYNPDEGLDSLDLSALPREVDERLLRISRNGSKFCGYTDQNRFFIWEASDPSDHLIVDGLGKDNLYFRKIKDDKFCFSATIGIGFDNYDSLYTLSPTGEITNLSEMYSLPYHSAAKVEFVGDSICTIYYGQGIYIVDETTGETNWITSELYDLPYGPIGIAIDETDNGLLIATTNAPMHEYAKTLHHFKRNGDIVNLETNPNYFVSYGGWFYPWINQHDDYFYMRLKSYYVYDGEQYHQFELDHPWFTDENLNEVDNHYPNLYAEDNEGNVYCSYRFNYAAWKEIDDTAFYMRINADYTHDFIDKELFDRVVEQRYLELGDFIYQVDEGVLNIFDEDFSPVEIEMPIPDSVTHIHGWKGRILVTSFDKAYLLNPETHGYTLLNEYSTDYPLHSLSNDRLGNFYFGNQSDLIKVPFYQDTVEQINAPDTVFMISNWLNHDWDGNIYATRTGRAGEFPYTKYGYIIYHNGFEWDLSNSILKNLAYRPGYYDLITRSRSNKAFLYTYHSSVEITCLIREISEIQTVYEIHDSSEHVQLELGNDFEGILWDDQSSDHQRSLNEPGNYWVKVSNERGCSTVKEFEVKLKSTSNYQNENIFYYFDTNNHPLILNEELAGDLFIYDLKGALVKQLEDYQNDWVPEKNLAQSMMVFAIYNEGVLTHSGRIFFL